MHYGAINNPLQNLLDEVRTLAKGGFEYLELCLDPPRSLPDHIRSVRGELVSLLAGEGMTLPVAHLPTFVWLADPYPSIRRASVDEVIRAMDLAAELGVSKAVLHPGYLTGMMRAASDLGRRYADESLVLLLEAARERNIVLCLENMFPRAGHMYRPEEFGQTLADHPDLMMTLDVAHALIGGPASRLTGLIEAGGRRIRHVHVSDHGGQEDDHLPLGAGRVPVQDALKRMKNLGYDDTITLEVFSSDRDLLFWSLRKVREWWEAL